ncbi:hypothetical protein AAHZ94_34180 [Streptomyces sp. HSW2009]|uniref:hypothetical protein n=1 Tax=Streptomyces sp. HSW2009 TaxID=3142890 RepID=UPI0032EB4407
MTENADLQSVLDRAARGGGGPPPGGGLGRGGRRVLAPRACAPEEQPPGVRKTACP